jgi:Ca2+-dependent lipid-binding protein
MSYLAKAKIHIIEADNVPCLDAFGGKSDPFVEVTLNGQHKKTKTINNSTHPVWDQKYEIPFEKMDDAIIFGCLFLIFF